MKLPWPLAFLVWGYCFSGFGYSSINKELAVETRIKELRARHNFTQEGLARKVNVRRETIVFLEKGKYNPSLQLAYDIAQVFSLPIEDIFIFKKETPL